MEDIPVAICPRRPFHYESDFLTNPELVIHSGLRDIMEALEGHLGFLKQLNYIQY